MVSQIGQKSGQITNDIQQKVRPKNPQASDMFFDDAVQVNSGAEKSVSDKIDYNVKTILDEKALLIAQRDKDFCKFENKIADLKKKPIEENYELFSTKRALDSERRKLSDEEINRDLIDLKNRLKAERDELLSINQSTPHELKFLRIDELESELRRIRKFQKRHALPYKEKALKFACDTGNALLLNAKKVGEVVSEKVLELGEFTSSYVKNETNEQVVEFSIDGNDEEYVMSGKGLTKFKEESNFKNDKFNEDFDAVDISFDKRSARISESKKGDDEFSEDKDYDIKTFLKAKANLLSNRHIILLSLDENVSELMRMKAFSEDPGNKLFIAQNKLEQKREELSNERINADLEIFKNRLSAEHKSLTVDNQISPNEKRFLRIDELRGEIYRINQFQWRHGLHLKAKVYNYATDKGNLMLSHAKGIGNMAVTQMGAVSLNMSGVANEARTRLGEVAIYAVDKVSELGEIVAPYIPSLESDDFGK